MPADLNLVTTNDCRQLECRVATVMAYCDLRRRMFWGAPSRRHKWQYILIATLF